MSEQGLFQITNLELIADLEAILLELRDRRNNYLDLSAALGDAVEHTPSIRERLVEIQRKDS
jgi:hypothetical protein